MVNLAFEQLQVASSEIFIHLDLDNFVKLFTLKKATGNCLQFDDLAGFLTKLFKDSIVVLLLEIPRIHNRMRYVILLLLHLSRLNVNGVLDRLFTLIDRA